MSLPSGDQGSGSSNQSGKQQPLFILSTQGKNTEESRRLVRAQAARASAAQSRVTRARNRGERESASAVAPSPLAEESTQIASPIVSTDSVTSSLNIVPSLNGAWPLAAWLPSIVGGAMGAVPDQTVDLLGKVGETATQPIGSTLSDVSSLPSTGVGFLKTGVSNTLQTPGKFQLPLALPRGFTILQQRIAISESMLGLLSRTACVDFHAPGVEKRLHQLIFDLIINIAGSALPIPTAQTTNPLQSHLRVACVCLTIFQGQRANGQVFAEDSKYQVGLNAAWSEATMLDKTALDEPKSAEASLWVMFMITVTTGATATFFHQQVLALLHDLQLSYWEQVRKVLLDFIYPVSFLDAPCKVFYDSLHQAQAAVG
ncbi:hypothetical protein LTR78_005378 [Recurvomyces mirabilis]|uniref:Uncharacterized protein n=1 Tax=Recurvomyces mirabilis TaxID=574656 RepID=A0AAE0WMY3_9PEZI|nr:hypothetical protein LTR78_005378 [Recurvomyces mirabilis]KAK5152715.1 hypothetical protein LTS14_008249 [Recurvomyces mirabilis]